MKLFCCVASTVCTWIRDDCRRIRWCERTTQPSAVTQFTTAAGCVHTADATWLDSLVSSASVVCIGHKCLSSKDCWYVHQRLVNVEEVAGEWFWNEMGFQPHHIVHRSFHCTVILPKVICWWRFVTDLSHALRLRCGQTVLRSRERRAWFV